MKDGGLATLFKCSLLPRSLSEREVGVTVAVCSYSENDCDLHFFSGVRNTPACFSVWSTPFPTFKDHTVARPHLRGDACTSTSISAQDFNASKLKQAPRCPAPRCRQLPPMTLQTKAVIELIHAQNDIAFIVVAPFSPFVCKLARVAVLASCGSAKF